MRFLIAAFVLTACLYNVSVAQIAPWVIQPCPNPYGCFCVKSLGTHEPPCTTPCVTGGDLCNNCWDFDIYACNDQLLPDSFLITAEFPGNPPQPACFSFCSPHGEFVEPDYRNNCDPNPKWPAIKQINGINTFNITTTNPGHIIICAPPGSVVHIKLVHHVGEPPCVQPCPTVDIQF